MIRINLRIDQAVSPWLYQSLFGLPARQRAERVRVLATLGLRLEANPGSSRYESSEGDSMTQPSDLAGDIKEHVLRLPSDED